MTAYEEAAFMADLLLGVDVLRAHPQKGLRAQNGFGDLPKGLGEERTATGEDFQILERIVDRLRAQTIHIAASCRRWRVRHGEATSALERRYSSYEGALCTQDLRQHWILYRHALGELMAMKRGRKNKAAA